MDNVNFQICHNSTNITESIKNYSSNKKHRILDSKIDGSLVIGQNILTRPINGQKFCHFEILFMPFILKKKTIYIYIY